MAVTKTGGDGQAYPASAWLYVPDASKPSTWKLRYKEYIDGKLKVTKRILGMAYAALTKGFRGSKVQLPDSVKQALLGKVRSLISSVGGSTEESSEVQTQQAIQEVATEVIYDTFEEVSLVPGKVDIDREAGILKGLAILGLKSKNNRVYKREAVKDAVARGVYEGLPCYKDHSDGRKVRSIDDAIGRWINSRYDEASDRVRADLKTLKYYRERILDFVDNGPTLAAPSHVVEGKVRRATVDGKEVDVVEHIERGLSVDLVAGAATVNSLLENERSNEMSKEVTEKDYNAESEDNELLKAMDALKEEVKALRDENAQLRERNEKAEKLAASCAVLESVLAESKLPDAARQHISEQYKETILTEEESKQLVEAYVAFVKSCGVDPSKPKVTVPTDPPAADKKFTLVEAFKRKTGCTDENKD